jgi:hypothetical protein
MKDMIFGIFLNIVHNAMTDVFFYEMHIFRSKTYAYLQNNKGPFILITATEFKIARATAATSAVPFLSPHQFMVFCELEQFKSCRTRRLSENRLIDYEQS